jgi:sulfite reductase (NADPH) hemoprotein beta-component
MKAVTGNRLGDGHPVYRTANGDWTAHIEDAQTFDDQEAAEEALNAAREQETIVVGTYLITVDAPGKPSPREAMRENIRAHGPTVRADLGRQGGA